MWDFPPNHPDMQAPLSTVSHHNPRLPLALVRVPQSWVVLGLAVWPQVGVLKPAGGPLLPHWVDNHTLPLPGPRCQRAHQEVVGVVGVELVLAASAVDHRCRLGALLVCPLQFRQPRLLNPL